MIRAFVSAHTSRHGIGSRGSEGNSPAPKLCAGTIGKRGPSMTLVSARGRHRDGSRCAFLFAANRTAHAPRYVIELGIPTAKLG
jgi:hypothetical protein